MSLYNIIVHSCVKSVIVSLLFLDSALFQLLIGPTDYCVQWNVSFNDSLIWMHDIEFVLQSWYYCMIYIVQTDIVLVYQEHTNYFLLVMGVKTNLSYINQLF